MTEHTDEFLRSTFPSDWMQVREQLNEALEVLAHIVSQANVNPVAGEDGFIARYDMPVGSIHRAIPFLQRHGIVVDEFGSIHKATEVGNLSTRGGETR